MREQGRSRGGLRADGPGNLKCPMKKKGKRPRSCLKKKWRGRLVIVIAGPVCCLRGVMVRDGIAEARRRR